MPDIRNWESFITDYFSKAGMVFSVEEYPLGQIIKTNITTHWIFCNLSKDKLTIKKLEFGRYLVENSMPKIERLSSWVKGCFVNSRNNNLDFLQVAIDSEGGTNYEIFYTEDAKKLIEDFLKIPFQIGWCEIDYRLGKGSYYKTCIEVKINEQLYKYSVQLLSDSELEVENASDHFIYRLLLIINDSFINDFRRHTERHEVKPILKLK